MSTTQHLLPHQKFDERECFENYIRNESFPCVGARSAINRGRALFEVYGRLGEPNNAQHLCNDLQSFSSRFAGISTDPVTFVAMFDNSLQDEAEFEHLMWRQLQLMHDSDRARYDWDSTVSDDPHDKDFSFSIAGRAFFVVGLSPVASRVARRSPMPCLVFNFHDQFEALRAEGKYAGLQRVVRNRDARLQGFINPMLSAYGEESEARQYSGRASGGEWKCPFSTGKSNGN